MAICSLHVSNMNRAASSSAIASYSYTISHRIYDECAGEAFSGFDRKKHIEHMYAILSEDTLDEYLDSERLFNVVRMTEKHSNVRPAEKIMVALSHEFDARGRFRALEDLISWSITVNGYTCMYAIRTDKNGRNPRARTLVANRRIDPKTSR